MSADIYRWDEFASSGRGLIAAPILPNLNRLALRADIEGITYKVKNMTTLVEVTGVVPITAMYTVAQPWDRDKRGFSFLWGASGDLWPTPFTDYAVVLEFTCVVALDSIKFQLAWRVSTKDPLS